MFRMPHSLPDRGTSVGAIDRSPKHLAIASLGVLRYRKGAQYKKKQHKVLFFIILCPRVSRLLGSHIGIEDLGDVLALQNHQGVLTPCKGRTSYRVRHLRALRIGIEKVLRYFQQIHIFRKLETCTAPVGRDTSIEIRRKPRRDQFYLDVRILEKWKYSCGDVSVLRNRRGVSFL